MKNDFTCDSKQVLSLGVSEYVLIWALEDGKPVLHYFVFNNVSNKLVLDKTFDVTCPRQDVKEMKSVKKTITMHMHRLRFLPYSGCDSAMVVGNSIILGVTWTEQPIWCPRISMKRQ